MGPHFMLLLTIFVLYSNVTSIYLVLCLVEIKLFQIVSNMDNPTKDDTWNRVDRIELPMLMVKMHEHSTDLLSVCMIWIYKCMINCPMVIDL